MLSPTNNFVPYIRDVGLSIIVGPGSAMVASVNITVPLTKVALAPNSTTFVYFNMATGTIQSSTNFVPSQCVPIATVTTNATLVTSLVDNRPDILISVT